MNEHHVLFVSIMKILVIIGLISVYILAGSLPMKVRNFRTNRVYYICMYQVALSLTSAITGGMFLAISLIQVLPQAVNEFPNHQTDFPIGQLVALLTFLLLLFLEKIVVGNYQTDNLGKFLFENVQQAPTESLAKQAFTDNEQIFKETISTKVRVALQLGKAYAKTGEGLGDIQKAQDSSLLDQGQPEEVSSPFRYYVVLASFSTYSIFQGFTVGLENQISNTLVIGVAMIFEKWSEGLASGFAFRQRGVNIGIGIRILLLQSMMSPVGIAIGWAISHASEKTIGVMQGISAGAFLYQATSEIIVEEFNISRFKLLKFLMFLLSIGVVAAFWPIEQNA